MDFFNAIALVTNFILLPGLTYGSQLALGALGVTLIYAVLRFSNFAHGELMSFGAMVCILFTWLGQSYGVSFGFFLLSSKKIKPYNFSYCFNWGNVFHCRANSLHYRAE